MEWEDSNRTFNFEFPGSEIADRPIVDRHRELGAFETLFVEPKMPFPKIARLFGSSHRFVSYSLYSEDIIGDTLVKEIIYNLTRFHLPTPFDRLYTEEKPNR